MPVSQSNSNLIYQALKQCGIGLLSMILARLAKEEEGVGLAVARTSRA